MNITQNERDLLIAIRDSEYHDGSDPVENRVWVDCIWGFEGKKKFPGTMSSLIKKGLAGSDGECCYIKQAGFDLIKDEPSSWGR